MYVVYHIKHKDMSTDDGYIGITCDYLSRVRVHKFHLKNNTHTNPKLQNVWNKYGDLLFEIIDEFETLEEVVTAEKLYRPDVDIGWNCKSGGEDYFRHSEETKKKISESLKGHKVSEGTKAKQSLAKKGKSSHMLGKTHSKETREKISNSRKGIKLPKEAIEKMVNTRLTFKDPINWINKDGRTFYGNHKELRDKMKEDKLVIGALIKVVRKEYEQHKGWSIDQ